MVQVTRKDEREANENIIRRFNSRVLKRCASKGTGIDAVCQADQQDRSPQEGDHPSSAQG